MGRKQKINRLVGFGPRAIGPYANRIGKGAHARHVGVYNLANAYIKDFNNWVDSIGVGFTQGDFFGRQDVWVLENLGTSGVTMTFDFTAEQSAGGPVLTPGVDYIISVDMYTPSSNVKTLAGTWYTTDTLGDRQGVNNPDVWEAVETTITFNPNDELFANAVSRFDGVAVGDQAAFDLDSMIIRRA